MPHYFIRIGALAEVRLAKALVPLEHGQRVVVRSPRGIEWAEVTGNASEGGNLRAGEKKWSKDAGDYKVLRPTSDSDELLIRRLNRHKRDAVETCREELRAAGSQSVLLDVDQMLNGGALLMHFLTIFQ